MNQIKVFNRLIAIAIISTPISALANTWSCTNNDIIRTIEIERAGDNPAPCNVNYTKETEGVEMKTLWSAENQGEYCDEKAEGLVAKLSSLGWACSKDEAATESQDTPAAEPQDTPVVETQDTPPVQ